MTVTLAAQTWPQYLWVVRHGESAGNVARAAAEKAGLPRIDIDLRDQDVPLSDLGREQSEILGRWFGALPEGERPTVILSSPFVRAMQTAQLISEASGLRIAPLLDERLREKEFGSLDRFTKAGIVAAFPHEAELRSRLGKFYYRPPGGESWCDVILRLRSCVDSIQLQYQQDRVLVVGHQVIVLCFRYLLEHMTEAQILAIDREKDVANCSMTAYRLAADDDGRPALRLDGYNVTAPLERSDTPITKAPDAPPASGPKTE